MKADGKIKAGSDAALSEEQMLDEIIAKNDAARREVLAKAKSGSVECAPKTQGQDVLDVNIENSLGAFVKKMRLREAIGGKRQPSDSNEGKSKPKHP